MAIEDIQKNLKGGNNQQPPIMPIQDEPIQETPQQISEITETVQQTPERKQIRSMSELVQMLRPQQLTPEEQEREKKRERSKAIIAAVSDGISSIANLYNTTRGAVSTPQISLSEANRKRYDAIIANRAKKQEAYINALERAGLGDIAQQYKEDLQRSQQQHDASESAKKIKAQADQFTASQKAKEDAAALEREFKQQENEKQRTFNAGQKAADRDMTARRIDAQAEKDRQTRIYNFKRTQGDEIPLVIGGRTYVVGSKALDKNLGNIVGDILSDMKEAPKFKELTEKQLMNNSEWRDMNRVLSVVRSDPKRMAEAMKLYAKDSPTALKTLQQLADYYDEEKRNAEMGEGAYLENFGFVPADNGYVNVEDLFD